MRCLRRLEIITHTYSVDMRDFRILGFLMRSLCVSLTTPATLEHIQFTINLEANESSFDDEQVYEALREADAWRDLDAIITLPIGSRLRRVDIDIGGLLDYDDGHAWDELDEDGFREAVLGALPRLRQKGILHLG
jgi:hypothetical protein